ncbi:unnamed protein product [Pleuronectes platessa]|uniref:Uncharacterized protein n=1 Tax=Pleuronectes platessa TaxID=8262 RepID=A0A9N7VYU2_PLEPL|nr:unnamed protein product [Pleuronectes platessa]
MPPCTAPRRKSHTPAAPVADPGGRALLVLLLLLTSPGDEAAEISGGCWAELSPSLKHCHPVVVGYKRANDPDATPLLHTAAHITHILWLFCQPDILVEGELDFTVPLMNHVPQRGVSISCLCSLAATPHTSRQTPLDSTNPPMQEELRSIPVLRTTTSNEVKRGQGSGDMRKCRLTTVVLSLRMNVVASPRSRVNCSWQSFKQKRQHSVCDVHWMVRLENSTVSAGPPDWDSPKPTVAASK